jgi:CheY-like chemotaxis protein/nitrogen-specific signal transduction histidine kinase
MRQANILAKEAEEKSKAANEAKGAFLSNMSHELRTPLNSILGYSQLMQRDATLSEENVKNLTIINKSGDHLLSLINDILEIAKIESRKSDLILVPFDFEDMIKDIDNMLRLRAEAKNLNFTISGIDKVSRNLIGDALKIRMVLINLIGNAIKFTDRGSVALSFDTKDQKGQDFNLYVEIEDTGCGISENERHKLFEFFSQTESGRASQAGTGLGLAISQEYVRLMGGRIDVSSRLGTGSKFYFDIHLQTASENSNHQRALLKTVIGFMNDAINPKILVAEDVKENRGLLIKLLESANFQVVSAENGQEALEKFEEHDPDFIWMDIRMPVMDGLEATRQIRMLDKGKKTKIVALSAHVFNEEREAILNSGFDDFLGKPFSENDIFSMMAKHLNLDYIYADQVAPEEEATGLPDTIAEEIGKLDKEKIRAIYEAIILLDDEKILKELKDIDRDVPIAARYLREEVLRMNYTKILRLVERGMK